LKLGIIGVIALGLLTSVVLAVGGEGGFFRERFPVKTRFADVQGLKPGAVVRLAGKEIGSVTSVDFAQAQVDVTMEILEEVRPIVTAENTTASIGSLSLLGEPVIDLKTTAPGTPVQDWAYLPSTGAGGFADLTMTAETALEKVGQLLSDIQAGRGTLGKLITDERVYTELSALLTSATDVTQALRSGKGTLPSLINDPAGYNALKASLQNLETMTQRINTGQGALGRLLNDEGMGKSISTTMANLETATGRIASGEGTMAKLINDSAVYDRMNNLFGRLDALVSGLESGQGTAGLLLKDRQLYESINGAVSEIRALLADIRRDPRKFLTVRVSIF
jgi:phospholipid/cholesterol/gamma-HCH transport system substrate-binding protein